MRIWLSAFSISVEMLSGVSFTDVLAFGAQLFLDFGDLLVDVFRQLDHFFLQELVFFGYDELFFFFFAHALFHFLDFLLQFLNFG